MKNRYAFISVLRVLAMFSIVAGHICSYFNIYLYDLGGVGVEAFLAISGYLYGQKVIVNRKEWIKNRVKRIMIPVWIWTLFLFILGSILDKPHYDLLPCMIGIQGACFLTRLNPPIYRAMAHTWFITVILMCYLIALLLCNENGQHAVDHHKWMIVAVSCVAQIILVRCGVQIVYFIVFFLGFVVARLEKKYVLRRAVLSFAVLIALGTIRIVLHGMENWFYNSVVAPWSAGAIGIFSLCFFEWAGTKWPNAFNRVAESMGWRYLDKISYSVYIVHYCFLYGFLVTYYVTKNAAVQLVIILLLTTVSAIALDWMTGIVNLGRKALKT